MRRFLSGILGLAAIAAAGAASAQDFAVDEERAAESVRMLVSGYIRPAFERFADNTELAHIAMADLCAKPGQGALDAARSAFEDSALSFARVEFLRTGPLVQDNRLERLLFWPDRRGIALRQVQAALAGRDESVTDAANMPAKSVGLQGYTALEYLLFGTGSDALTEEEGSFRCRFAEAVAANMHSVAVELDDVWSDKEGYAASWTNPGADNPSFRNAEEVVSELLSIPAEAFEIIRDQRLQPIAPDENGKANPKSAPFWRSGLSLDFVASGLAGLRTYFDTAGIAGLLPEDQAWQANSIEFEFNNADATLQRLQSMPIADILADADRAADLGYLVILTRSLQKLFGEQLTATLGLSVGFSSLDGD